MGILVLKSPFVAIGGYIMFALSLPTPIGERIILVADTTVCLSSHMGRNEYARVWPIVIFNIPSQHEILLCHTIVALFLFIAYDLLCCDLFL